MLAADRDTIVRAHRYRKMWGGGMRQAGILAAACLYALANHLDRLAEDHEKAGSITAGLDQGSLAVNHPVDTNIVIIDVAGPGQDQALLAHLAARGILGVGFGVGRVRLIPHLDTPSEAMPRVLEALNSFPGE